jgi:hypothetical protein
MDYLDFIMNFLFKDSECLALPNAGKLVQKSVFNLKNILKRDISKSMDFGISFLKKMKKPLDLELTPRSKITLNVELLSIW